MRVLSRARICHNQLPARQQLKIKMAEDKQCKCPYFTRSTNAKYEQALIYSEAKKQPDFQIKEPLLSIMSLAVIRRFILYTINSLASENSAYQQENIRRWRAGLYRKTLVCTVKPRQALYNVKEYFSASSS